MSVRKHCSYKGCDSNRTKENVTFFQFPREENRYNLWMKLSRCENKDTPIKYLCSKHFDERKYISRNPRRLLLLASAIPYPYVSDNEDNDENNEAEVVTSKSDYDDFIIQSMDVSDMDETGYTYAESTNEIDYIRDDVASKSDGVESRKRKLSSDAETIKNSKTSNSDIIANYAEKNEITTSKTAVDYEEQQVVEVEETEDVIEDPNITTFIFKGEEYIQMPKRIYVQEKHELLASLQYYKNIVAKIKSQVANVKI